MRAFVLRRPLMPLPESKDQKEEYKEDSNVLSVVKKQKTKNNTHSRLNRLFAEATLYNCPTRFDFFADGLPDLKRRYSGFLF